MTTQDYIRRNKKIAIRESIRSGIPASITVGQGILESASGNSYLAKAANNHFGIKCHSDWYGEYVRADDDLPQECFRKYKSVLDSYKDHTAFLKKYSRYKPLFKLSPTNYVGWAIGLQNAGYATSPTYAQKLINLVKTYKLDELDQEAQNKKLLLYIGIPVGVLLLATAVFVFIYYQNKKHGKQRN